MDTTQARMQQRVVEGVKEIKPEELELLKKIAVVACHGEEPENFSDCDVFEVDDNCWGSTTAAFRELRYSCFVVADAKGTTCTLTQVGFGVIQAIKIAEEKGQEMAEKKAARKKVAKKAPVKKAAVKKAAVKKAPVKKEATKKPFTQAVPREKQNGIALPKDGCTCSNLWKVLDKLAAKKGDAPTRKECMAAAVKAGFHPSTSSVQYRRWAIYNDCHKVKA